MLIGELSRLTGVSTRLLRYYEEQELFVPQRNANGYRVYPDYAPVLIGQIRGLLDSGLTTRAIRDLMPCLCEQGLRHCGHTRAVLDGSLDRIERQIAELNGKRDLLAAQIDGVARRPYRTEPQEPATGPDGPPGTDAP